MTNELMAKAFQNLSKAEHSRFLDIRGRAMELALLYPSLAKERLAESHPLLDTTGARDLSREDRVARMAEITAKGLSRMSKTEAARLLLLQQRQPHGLTTAEYEERVGLTDKFAQLLTEEERAEFLLLSAGLME